MHRLVNQVVCFFRFPLERKRPAPGRLACLLALQSGIEKCIRDSGLDRSGTLWNRLYKEPQVTQVIRSNRLRWLGNIWRSPGNNRTRAYTFKNPMGSRTRGRPPKRWI
ncbi:endonuclease-reverse transcriptase [Trichonephila clavipes]|uniref:Endonuclease-reverse transcriptase n=1 Tax=Trichonephila clavipes TaxID=2585209 RepID=A0A8X6UX09_TRICX|nr:endonuclease-reverse transcriptase [Trichonephila clavipes]